MANPIHKLVGPMLRRKPPATVEEVTDLLVTPVGLRAPREVVDEWINIARRRNGQPSTSAIIGKQFRTDQELRRHPRRVMAPPKKKHSYLQRLARRITRMFRK